MKPDMRSLPFCNLSARTPGSGMDHGVSFTVQHPDQTGRVLSGARTGGIVRIFRSDVSHAGRGGRHGELRKMTRYLSDVEV